MDIDFDKLKEDVVKLAHETFSEFGKDVEADVHEFIESSKNKVIDWIKLFISGSLSRGEFMWLLNSQIDLMKLEGLKEAGIAAIKLDMFRMKVINVIIDVAAKIIL